MKTYRLVPHPAYPPDRVTEVAVELWVDAEELLLTFRVEDAESLRLPATAEPARRDGLWKASCFELFLRPMDTEEYFEFNLSPSGEWAAYRFSGYREGMAELPMPVAPVIDRGVPPEDFVIEADIDLASVPPGAFAMGISAVIEEVGGQKSYWALNHPPGDTPDFHHADCFAAELSPADEA